MYDVLDGITLRHFKESDASELFKVVDKNRNFLRKTLPWLDNNKTEIDSLNFIKHVNEEKINAKSLVFGIFKGSPIIGTVGFNEINVSDSYLNYKFSLTPQKYGLIG